MYHFKGGGGSKGEGKAQYGKMGQDGDTQRYSTSPSWTPLSVLIWDDRNTG